MPQINTVKWRFPPPGPKSLKWRVYGNLACGVVGGISKIWLELFNKAKIYNKEVLTDLVESRGPSVPLVTVSNHDSCLDDPLLWGMLKMRTLCNADVMRWTLGAHDIMFTKEAYNWFFSYGQVVPVVRGNGVYQKSVDFVIEQLNRGKWVHVFPEGKVNMTNEYLRLKWGVGRMIADSNVTPIVLPFWHRGIDDVLPNYKYIPRLLKKVTINVGNPMDFKELIDVMKKANKSPLEMRKIITDIIQEEFKSLREATDKLHFARLANKDSDSDSKQFTKPSLTLTNALDRWNELRHKMESTTAGLNIISRTDQLETDATEVLTNSSSYDNSEREVPHQNRVSDIQKESFYAENSGELTGTLFMKGFNGSEENPSSRSVAECDKPNRDEAVRLTEEQEQEQQQI